MAIDKSEKKDVNAGLVEISEEKLMELLNDADLSIAGGVQVVTSLEIRAGAMVARQYDR